MGIVNWTTDNVDEDSLKSSEEVTLSLLKMTPAQLNTRWEGKLIIKPRGIPKVKVELRKSIGGTNVLVKIYNDTGRFRDNSNRLVHISMNASASLSEEDLNTMTLAMNEGIEVYRLPAHWVKLNKYIEESNARIKRRREREAAKTSI